MLAQNFKTPADLEISDAEFEALVKVLGMLERGELVHVRPGELLTVPNGFNIHVISRREECGTMACFLGWARIVGNSRELFNARGPAIATLFQMDNSYEKPDVTVEQAAIALRSYLTSGEANWEEALAR